MITNLIDMILINDTFNLPVTAVADSGFLRGRGNNLKREPVATKGALFLKTMGLKGAICKNWPPVDFIQVK